MAVCLPVMDAPTTLQREQAAHAPDRHWLLQRLGQNKRGLGSATRTEILALGPTIVGPLLEILQDEVLIQAEVSEGGWAPLHAAWLLRDLKAVRAIEPMLRTLENVQQEDWFHEELTGAIASFASSALEPTLACYASACSEDYRSSLCIILSSLGVHDDRIFSCLVEELARSAELGAMALADYGDTRALENLGRAFDEFELSSSDNPIANHTMIEFKAAIEALGGSLSLAQRQKFQKSREAGDRWRKQLGLALDNMPAPAPRASVPGRNEPCWCGNGVKYKKCHLRADEAES